MSQFLEAFLKEHLPLGDILEIGYSESRSKLIQKFQPKSHLIIETKEVEVAKEVANVLIGDWREVFQTLECKFDLIFFDETEIQESVEPQTLRQANLFLSEGKTLLNNIEKTFPEIKKVKYTQKEIDLLLEKESPEEIAFFLSTLVDKEQLSEELFQAFIKKYSLEKPSKKTHLSNDLFSIVDQCMNEHIRTSGKFLCLSSSLISKYENGSFFEKIITNPNYDYSEEAIDEKLAIQIKKLE